jgi:3-deoxy-D-manno-octulosonic acid kinase
VIQHGGGHRSRRVWFWFVGCPYLYARADGRLNRAEWGFLTEIAEILTEWLPATRSLVSRLKDAELEPAEWRRIGATLRRFHQAGARHADLNAHNILIDEAGRVFLLDFDRGALLTPDGAWTRGTLARLKRSLEKVHATGRALYYTPEGWNQLLGGYANP